MSAIITRQMLTDAKACPDQLAEFDRLFPDGTAKVTVTRARKLSAVFCWVWAVRFLDRKGRAEYRRATAAAWAECERATAAAWAEYKRATAPALAEYKRATAPALAEYKRATAPALAEYQRVTDAARAECERATAAAWAKAYIATCKRRQGQ